MKIVSISETAAEPFIHDVFTGPEVTRQELAPGDSEFEVTVVNFDKGMRNKLHTHDGEQILIVAAGEGIVATGREKRRVSAGDVVFIEPGRPTGTVPPRIQRSPTYISR